MSININKTGLGAQLAFIAVASVGLIGVAYVSTELDQHTFKDDQGISFLQNKGYANVQGGNKPAWGFNGCSGHNMSRDYSVTDASGTAMKKTVCFDELLGAYFAHLPSPGR